MIDLNHKYTFEYQDLPNGVRIVSLDCRIKDLHPQPKLVNGEVKMMLPAVTTKDCTKIDGCIYYYKGRCSETYINELVELFQKSLKLDKNWKKNQGINFILPNGR